MAVRRPMFLAAVVVPALCVRLAVPALAEPPRPFEIAGTLGFDLPRPQRVCAKVAGALLTRLTKDYRCAPPEDGGQTGSGVTSVGTCTPKAKRDSEYMLFATATDQERETQLANAE